MPGHPPAHRGTAWELGVHGAAPAPANSQASRGCGPNPAPGRMGDVPLHCRGGTGPGIPPPASVGLWLQTRLLPGEQGWHRDAAAAGGFVPCWAPGQRGRPPSGRGGRQRGTPGLSHPTRPRGARPAVPYAAGWHHPGGVPSPPPPRVSAWGGGLPQKSLSQRATAAEDWVPHLPSVPATFGCPPRSPPLPAQPYPFQVELSWGGGSRGAGTGGEGAGGGERGERSKNGGRGEEEEQGIKLATKKPRGLKTAEFHTRSALERYRTRFGSDARGGSGGSS